MVAIQQMRDPRQGARIYLAIDYQGGIERAWANLATFVPELVAALLILLVGWFVAKAPWPGSSTDLRDQVRTEEFGDRRGTYRTAP